MPDDDKIKKPKRKKYINRALKRVRKPSTLSAFQTGAIVSLFREIGIDVEITMGSYIPRNQKKPCYIDIAVFESKIGLTGSQLDGVELVISVWNNEIEIEIGKDAKLSLLYRRVGSKVYLQLLKKNMLSLFPILIYGLNPKSENYDENISRGIIRILQYFMRGELEFREDSLDRVVGLDDIKEKCLRILQLRTRSDYTGMDSRNILLAGKPGCGKSKLMRALATEFKDDGIILDFVYAQHLEDWLPFIAKIARSVNAPILLCLDEIDEIGLSRDVQGTHVYSFLRALDGMSNISNVTFIATTNRPQDIDRALLRPGRFSPVFIVPLPDKKARLELFGLFLKLHGADVPGSSVELWAGKTDGWSGADIRAVIESQIYYHGEITQDLVDAGIVEAAKEKKERGNLWKNMDNGTPESTLYQ